MSRLAYVDETNTVTRVIIAEPDFDPTAILGDDIVSPGFIYSQTTGFFYPPKPFPSWTMAENSPEWLPPVPKPEEGVYNWDEETLAWVEVIA